MIDLRSTTAGYDVGSQQFNHLVGKSLAGRRLWRNGLAGRSAVARDASPVCRQFFKLFLCIDSSLPQGPHEPGRPCPGIIGAKLIAGSESARRPRLPTAVVARGCSSAAGRSIACRS